LIGLCLVDIELTDIPLCNTDLVFNTSTVLVAEVLVGLYLIVRHHPIHNFIDPYADEDEDLTYIKLELLKVHPERVI
jgi:hypothetical protein